MRNPDDNPILKDLAEALGPAETFRDLFAAELPRLYAFAFHMSGGRSNAFEHLRELLASDVISVLDAPAPRHALLGHLARRMEESLGRRAENNFTILDNILRDDITRPIDANTPGIDGDLRRVHPLLWELKRTCLSSVLGCLPPAVRVSFVLTDIFGLSVISSAELVGINETAYRVRRTRAHKRLNNYLGACCQHIDAANPCNCEGRLGVALAKDFISFPPHVDDVPVEAHDAAGEQHVDALYKRLPWVALTSGQRDELLVLAGGVQ